MRMAIDFDGNITEHEDAPIVEQIESEILAQKISEANAYLASTDWVEPYILRHELGINVLPDDSNKLAIHAKREETRAFLRANQ